jgi:hypothetical protein
MFQNVIIGWIARRALEFGGIIGAALTAWNNLPPATQDAILSVLGRNWETITLGALAPIALSLWGYVWSFLSTVKPQVVTADKRQIPVAPETYAASRIEAEAIAAPKPRTLWERLTSR